MMLLARQSESHAGNYHLAAGIRTERTKTRPAD